MTRPSCASRKALLVGAMSWYGTVEFFHESKGFGFIDYVNGNIFVHKTDVHNGPPGVGDAVTFDVTTQTDAGKLRAINVNIVGFAPGRSSGSVLASIFRRANGEPDDNMWEKGSSGNYGDSFYGGSFYSDAGHMGEPFDDSRFQNDSSFRPSRGGSTRGGSGPMCFLCGAFGHRASNCPELSEDSEDEYNKRTGRPLHCCKADSSGTEDSAPSSRSVTCFNCGETGHTSRRCPSLLDKGGGKGRAKRNCDDRGGGVSCYRCNETGHFARDCPNGAFGKGRGKETVGKKVATAWRCLV